VATEFFTETEIAQARIQIANYQSFLIALIIYNKHAEATYEEKVQLATEMRKEFRELLKNASGINFPLPDDPDWLSVLSAMGIINRRD
jgi:hypothetical protein